MTVSPTTLGHYIKFHRESHSLTQKELAEKADVSPATISGTENERFIPSPEILHRLARALQVPFHELVERLPPQKTDVLLEIARIYRNLIQYDRAMELIMTIKSAGNLLDYQRDSLMLEEGLTLILKPETRLQGIELLNALALTLDSSGSHDLLFMAKVRNAIGSAWFKHKDFYTAKYHYQRALDLLYSCPVIEDKFISGLYYNIAYCLQMFQQEELAIEYLNKAIPLLEKQQFPYYLASCYYTLGSCYKSLGQLQVSADFFWKAVPLYEEAGSKLFAVLSQDNAYFLGPEPPEVVIPILEKELEDLQTELTNGEKMVTLSRIALLCLDLQDLTRANVYLDVAAQLISPSDKDDGHAYYLLTKAKALLASGDFEESSSYAIEASELYSSLRYFNSNLKDALNTARVALQRLRESFGQKKSS